MHAKRSVFVVARDAWRVRVRLGDEFLFFESSFSSAIVVVGKFSFGVASRAGHPIPDFGDKNPQMVSFET